MCMFYFARLPAQFIHLGGPARLMYSGGAAPVGRAYSGQALKTQKMSL